MFDRVSIGKDDRLPTLRRTLYDRSGPVDLTGIASAPKFWMRNINTDVLKVNGVTAVVVGAPTDGVVEYPWAAGDTDTLGKYVAWFTVEHVTGKVASYPDVLQRILVIVNDGSYVG